jgi:hypothetical protein
MGLFSTVSKTFDKSFGLVDDTIDTVSKSVRTLTIHVDAMHKETSIVTHETTVDRIVETLGPIEAKKANEKYAALHAKVAAHYNTIS